MVYGEFNIAVIPDTQYYSAYWPVIFEEQVQWVCGCADKIPLNFVTHLGDLVEHGLNRKEWEIAKYALNCLQYKNIPFGFSVGNHDNNDNSDIYKDNSDYTLMNDIFKPIIDYKKESSNMIFYNLTHGYENNLEFINDELIFIHLAFKPDYNVRNWVIEELNINDNYKAIIVTHWALGDCNDDIAGFIKHIIRDTNNIILVLSGHKFSCGGENMNTYRGIPIVTQDYQARNHGGDSWTRIIQFTNNEFNDICFYTFNPKNQKSELDTNSYMWFKNEKFINDSIEIKNHCKLNINKKCAFSYDQGAIFLIQLFSYTLYTSFLFISIYRFTVV